MRSVAAHVVLAVRLASGVVIALSAASCSLISGASDLEIALSRADGGGDGATNDAARDGATTAVDEPGSKSDGGGSGDGGSGDGGGGDAAGACRALNQTCTGGPLGDFGPPGAGPCCAPLVCGDARKCLACLPLFDDCTSNEQCCSKRCDAFGKVCM